MLLPDLERCAAELANNVCWTLSLMINLGELEIDEGWRTHVARDLWPWAMIAMSDMPGAEPVTEEQLEELASYR